MFPCYPFLQLKFAENKVQNQIMIQNPQKLRYFQSGKCSRKLSSNCLQKMCQNAELVLRFGVIMIRDELKIFLPQPTVLMQQQAAAFQLCLGKFRPIRQGRRQKRFLGSTPRNVGGELGKERLLFRIKALLAEKGRYQKLSCGHGIAASF